MMRERWTIGLGLVFLVLALLALFVWIPLDVETGAVEIFRRERNIGDAMLPMALAIVAIGVSLAMMAGAWRDLKRKAAPPSGPEETGLGASASTSGELTRDNGLFLLALLVVLSVSLGLMYALGPFALSLANLAGAETASYRELRATAPWKFIGYGVGGTLLVVTLISFVEQHFRWRTLAIAVAAVAVIAFLYDGPFDNLLLPPNGDY